MIYLSYVGDKYSVSLKKVIRMQLLLQSSTYFPPCIAYICVCKHVCMCVYIYVYANTHTTARIYRQKLIRTDSLYHSISKRKRKTHAHTKTYGKNASTHAHMRALMRPVTFKYTNTSAHQTPFQIQAPTRPLCFYTLFTLKPS